MNLTSTTHVSLRHKKGDALRRMLNLSESSKSVEPQWKVLVYDRFGQDIISPLLSVRDLRDLGVTLYLPLHSDREQIVDVSAVYFVSPTTENIQRICKDLHLHLYDSYYFNFISPVSRHKLEDLAQAAIGSDSVQSISKVFDQYTNFICLEDDLFVLRHHMSDEISYFSINRPDVTESDMDSLINNIVDGLFSVFVTLGTVPIIRCPKGNAAEMVAQRLDKKMKDNIRDTRNTLFNSDISSGQFSFQRPVLILLDRSLDLGSMLHHTWTYQALVHDILGCKLNRVELDLTPSNRPGQGKIKKSYDLIVDEDNFWSNQRGAPFPEVAEAVKKSLENYKSQEEEVTKLKRNMGLEGDVDDAAIMESTSVLSSAMNNLPALVAMKKNLDMHMNIASGIAEQIKSRQLDLYFELEEKLLAKQSLDRSLKDVVTDPETGTLEDKLRLILIAILYGPGILDAELDELVSLLSGHAQLDASQLVKAIAYIRRWKAITRMSPSSAYSSSAAPAQSRSSILSSWVSKGGTFLMEGVKNLVVRRQNLQVTRVTDAVMDNRGAPEIEEYHYFDPKLHRVTDPAEIPRQKTPFHSAVVFVVGGGNYVEYQNLMDYKKNKNSAGISRKVTYGCTELVNASQFLRQLSQLG